MSYNQLYFWTVEDSDNSDAGDELRKAARQFSGHLLDETLVGFEREETGFKGELEEHRDELSVAGQCWVGKNGEIWVNWI